MRERKRETERERERERERETERQREKERETERETLHDNNSIVTLLHILIDKVIVIHRLDPFIENLLLTNIDPLEETTDSDQQRRPLSILLQKDTSVKMTLNTNLLRDNIVILRTFRHPFGKDGDITIVDSIPRTKGYRKRFMRDRRHFRL